MLGSMWRGKTTLVQELVCQSRFGKLRQVHWISKVQLSKHREAEIGSCFSPKVEFYSPRDDYDLKKTFNNLENIYWEREEKLKLEDALVTRGNGMEKYVERDSFVILDNVSGVAKKSMAFIFLWLTAECLVIAFSKFFLRPLSVVCAEGTSSHKLRSFGFFPQP